MGKGNATVYGHIYHNFTRPPWELVQGFEKIWTATISDAMGKHGLMLPEIRPFFTGINVLGVAFTVLNYPNDNITTHKALLMVQPGDVLVIDEGRGNYMGSFGHNMSLQARNRGVAGVVTNGHARDARLLREERFPIFCLGSCPRQSQKNTPGSINIPVHVGGIVVCPGDIVVGDDDGVAVVPLRMAEEVLKIAKERQNMEYQQARDIREGKKPLEILYGDNWVDAALKGKVKEFK